MQSLFYSFVFDISDSTLYQSSVLVTFGINFLSYQVKNSRTRNPFSYEKDFRDLINIYARKNTSDVTQELISPELVYASDNSCSTSNDSSSVSFDVLDGIEDDPLCGSSNRVSFQTAKSVLKERNMSVEYLEDECDLLKDADDLDGKLHMNSALHSMFQSLSYM